MTSPDITIYSHHMTHMYMHIVRTYHDRKFWSGTFILLSLSVGVLLVLRWLQTRLGGHHPIALVLIQTFTQPLHVRREREEEEEEGRGGGGGGRGREEGEEGEEGGGGGGREEG